MLETWSNLVYADCETTPAPSLSQVHFSLIALSVRTRPGRTYQTKSPSAAAPLRRGALRLAPITRHVQNIVGASLREDVLENDWLCGSSIWGVTVYCCRTAYQHVASGMSNPLTTMHLWPVTNVWCVAVFPFVRCVRAPSRALFDGVACLPVSVYVCSKVLEVYVWAAGLCTALS